MDTDNNFSSISDHDSEHAYEGNGMINSEHVYEGNGMINSEHVYEGNDTSSNEQIYVFNSNAGVHKIVVECDFVENNALINTMIVKNELPIDLVLLLKRMTYELLKLGINTIVQHLNMSDWDYIEPLNVFEYVECSIYGKVIVKCDISKFAESVMKALGFI